MKRFLRAGVCVVLLALTAARIAVAQEAKPAPGQSPAMTMMQDDVDREDPCPNAATQPDLNRCAARARDRADAELNKVYRQLMNNTSGTERGKLRAAQLAWLKFRDAQCDYESVGNKGGSIYPMVFSFCLAGVTKARVEQLQEILREQTEQ